MRWQRHTDLFPWTDLLHRPYFSIDTSVCDYDIGTAAVVHQGNAKRATETQYRNVGDEKWKINSVTKNLREDCKG